MYTAELREVVSQGDVFGDFSVVDIKFVEPNSDPVTAIRKSPGILLSNDCDYDHGKYVMVAEIKLLSMIKNEHQDNVRNGQSRRTFYLSELPGQFAESFVDFRGIHRIEKQFISGNEQGCTRIASLTDHERLALRRSIGVFFGIDPDKTQ